MNSSGDITICVVPSRQGVFNFSTTWLPASFMTAVDISTTNFSTFSELAFQFKLTPLIALQALLFALTMGFVGGLVPAWRATRLKIVDCLRAA